MARRRVLEVTCDRCDRTETQELTEEGQDPNLVELQVTFHGESVQYGDLCNRCRSAIEGYFAQMTKQVAKPKVEDVPKGKSVLSRVMGTS